MSILSKPYFHDEEAAHTFLEGILWPLHKPICPNCGGFDQAYKIAANPAKKVRVGLWKCGHCRKQFTIKVATVFEGAHIPLHKCLQATYLLASSKKGISSNQLARTLEITVKSAWFLSHRIREAMRDSGVAPIGGPGNIVEVDETFLGRDPAKPKRRGTAHKYKVLSLVDRATGKARSMVIDDLKAKTVVPVLKRNIARESRIMTDEAGQYRKLARHFKGGHEVLNHGKEEYVRRGDDSIHTNTIEGFFSIFKRGMKGTYQHCGAQHIHRYLAEFDFRYSNRVALGVDDPERAIKVLAGSRGKRLLYRDSRVG
jgi:transposase-like protein